LALQENGMIETKIRIKKVKFQNTSKKKPHTLILKFRSGYNQKKGFTIQCSV
jgi:hypothetical protein